MYDAISRLYCLTKNTTLVKNAIKKGWITEEAYQAITGEVYSE